MRITKNIRVPDIDVDVEITGEDAVEAIIGETHGWTPRQLMLRVLNNLAAFFKALPDSVIAELNSDQRGLIAGFFEEQAKRFRQ